MSELEPVSEAIFKSVLQLDKKFQQKLIQHRIFHLWKEIAGPYAEDIFPVKVIDKTLILYAKTSAAKDTFKYIAKDILDKANELIGDGNELYQKIDFAKNFNRQPAAKKISRKVVAKKFSVDDIQLSDAEISDCKEKVSKIKNPDLKKIAFQTLITQKKSYKLKIQAGWKKCKCCDSLCPPKKIICDSCRVSERDKMRRTIRQIFLRDPCVNFFDVLEGVKNFFPYLAREITVEVVSSERSALINSLARKVSVGDTKSDAAKTLVQIYKQIPAEKLTDAIMNRALQELRFNLADIPYQK